MLKKNQRLFNIDIMQIMQIDNVDFNDIEIHI